MSSTFLKVLELTYFEVKCSKTEKTENELNEKGKNNRII